MPQIKLITRESALLSAASTSSNVFALFNVSVIPSADYFSPSFALFNKVLIGDTAGKSSSSNSLQHERQQWYVHVEEGANATLDCLIIAKPKVTVVRWTHNLAEIWHETEGKFVFYFFYRIYIIDCQIVDTVFFIKLTFLPFLPN